MADALNETEARPPVPGFWRLGWLLFMQPLTLRRLFVAWDLKGPFLWKLGGRLKQGDLAWTLVARLSAWLLLVTPLSTVTLAGSLNLAGLPVNWRFIAIGVAVGIAAGIAVSLAGSIIADAQFGLTVGVVVGISLGIGWGLTYGVFFGSPAFRGFSSGMTLSVSMGNFLSSVLAISRNKRSSFYSAGVVTAFLMALGTFFGISFGASFGTAFGTASALTLPLTLFRLPLYLVEVAFSAVLRLIARLHPTSLPRLASLLPHRHHELIFLPLPFLASFLVQLGEEHRAEGRRALAEAAASLGQKGPARQALMELQARSLERAAREKRYASTAALTLPFLPERESLAISEFNSGLGYLVTINSIAAAAQDLEAARSTGSYHQHRQALARARRELERTLDRLTATRRLPRDERRFLPVVKQWLDRVEDEETALARLEQEQPQVPLVFVAGPALTPTDESLFVGRSDLVRLLDQDLAAERPVPLVLLGQRRMGKSTLLNFLPRLLGTGTRVVRLDFQGLSGNRLRSEPHQWVAAEVATTLAREKIIEVSSTPPEQASWGAILDWLAALEEPLAASDQRLLIALDEVEALQRGIREGWSDPAFLDFLRAAGDRLRRIRFLLVTAHPFSRLGPHWSDRLISAQTRRIEPLREDEARVLLTQPVPGFPDIYPPGGVERLLTETACHPYLLQLTAYDLTRRLNDAGRLKATDDDLTAALDQTLEENNLFQNLWDDLSATERGLLASLSRGEELPDATETLSQARRDLAREQLIQRHNTGEGWRVAVPLFARWICEIGAAE